MTGASRKETEERVLLLAPTATDAANAQRVLAGAGVACAVCQDVAEVCRELGAGAGAALLTEEALAAPALGCLAEVLSRQPPWSDVPVLVLTRGGADSPAAAHASQSLPNVVLLERPVRMAALVSAVRTALRARRRQYEIREHLAERRRAEQALQEAHRQATDILESITDGFLTMDRDWRFTYVNAEAERAIGRSRESLLGKDHWQEFPATLGSAVDREYRRAAAEQVPVEFENYYAPWQRWFEIKAYPTQGGGLTVYFRDITERKRAAQALREAEGRLRMLLESVQDYAIFALDVEGRVATWNTGAERVFGFTEEEILGQSAGILFTPEDREAGAPEQELTKAAETGRAEDERWHVRKDGSRFFASGVVTPIRDGELHGFTKVARDITDRKRAEEALRESNRRLQLLSETAGQLLLADKPQDFIQTLFGKLSSHLDLEVFFHYLVSEDGRSLRLDSYGGVSVEVAQRIERMEFGQAVCGCVAQERGPVVAEDVQCSPAPRTEFLRSIGVTAYACQPLLAQGRLIGTLSFGTRKRPRFNPDELTLMRTVCDQVAMTLERARLTRELQQRVDRLAESDKRKDEFLAMLGHELRNPLAPIRNASQVLRLIGPSEPNLLWAREVIERQVQHLSRLVDDLLDVSRITRGKVRLHKEPVELAAVLGRAVETSRPLIDTRRHELIVALPPQPVRLEADPTRLAQVFSNLLNNAAKYTGEGGKIWLTAEYVGGGVEVRVRDSGMGMTPETLAHAFELFTQADHSLDRSQGGLGIGLTLVRSLVEMHGGSVEATSPGPGQGSEFVVRLPASAEVRQEGEAREADRPPTPAAAPLRILAVDDNVDAAESLAMMLRITGHEVHTAHDGPAALEAARVYRPEVVLLDIGLPGMSGHEVARRLRQEPDLGHVTLVALTGYGQEEDRHRSQAAGFDAHLVKPVDPRALEELLGQGAKERSQQPRVQPSGV